MTVPALLALEDGSIFRGISIGAPGQVTAQVVFSTAASGYQELLSDPALTGKFLTLTYPVAGSVGVNAEDAEADGISAAGLIVRELSPIVSNWRAEQSLSEHLKQHGVVGIAEIDTRRLTRKLRHSEPMGACIQCGELDEEAAIAAAKQAPKASRIDSSANTFDWQEGIWHWGKGYQDIAAQGAKIAVYDFGVARSLLRVLAETGAQATVVPANSTAADIKQQGFDAVVLSNGPGPVDEFAAEQQEIKTLLEANMPLFGVGLGLRLMAAAEGAKTVALNAGHYGGSHPVRSVESGQVLHADQRNDAAVNADTLPAHIQVSHKSLFDDSVQGLQWRDNPAQGFQGSPRASVNSAGADELIRQFVASLSA